MPKNQLNRIAALSGAGIQLAGTIFVGAYLGNYLDREYPISDRKLYTLLFVLVFTALAMYNVLKQVKRINKD